MSKNNVSKLELRYLPAQIEVRKAEKEADMPHIVGYAAVWNTWSEDLGGFKERFAPHAFAKSLTKADVRALWNHDPNYVLGRRGSQTLDLNEDEDGLAFDVLPPDTSWARDLVVTMQRGDVNQMSFGFRAVADSWEQPDDSGDKLYRRTVLDADLYDVSVVTFPAYHASEAHLRALGMESYIPELPQGGRPGQDNAGQAPRVAIARRRVELAEIEL
ncbi:MAG: prohead protease [Phage 5P_3]|nr:MAG: prohead protease [Phage 5P_3]